MSSILLNNYKNTLLLPNTRRTFSDVYYDAKTLVRPRRPNLLYCIADILHKCTMVGLNKIVIQFYYGSILEIYYKLQNHLIGMLLQA